MKLLMMESFINVKSVAKSSLRQGPWEFTKELLKRASALVVTIVHKRQEKKVSFGHMKHLFIKEHNETNSMYVPPAPKDFTGKVI